MFPTILILQQFVSNSAHSPNALSKLRMRRKKSKLLSRPGDFKGTESRKNLIENYILTWEEQITKFNFELT